MSLLPGQILNGRYQIIRLLGQGGFGAVYQVWDLHLERFQALKENLSISPVTERQFKREATLLSTLVHPNLPRVIDHFVLSDNSQYLVMDFIEGRDLQAMLEEKGEPLPEEQAVSWILQVCDALEFLHAQTPPIIHRDVKPANIRITPTGKAMLVDFGIAKIYQPDSTTTKGAQAVSPGFSPLEQYSRGGRTDARTDVYSVSATLYYALTGYPPTDALERSLGEELSSVRALNPAVSIPVAEGVMNALALYPDGRTSSITEFRHHLEGDWSKSSAFPASGRVDAEPAKPVDKPVIQAGQGRRATGFRLKFLWVAGLAGFMVLAGIWLASGLTSRNGEGDGVVAQPVQAVTTSAPNPVASVPQMIAAETATPLPNTTLSPTLIPTAAPGILEILFCDRPCSETGAVQTKVFPQETQVIYYAFRYQGMRPGLAYTRYWTNQGLEWVRYQCIWQGPADGVFYGKLWDGLGLRSGVWEITIELEGQYPFKETVQVDGSNERWSPNGLLPCQDW